MLSIANILQERIEGFKSNPKLAIKNEGLEYQKHWNLGIKFFELEVNKQRKKEGLSNLPFIAIRNKLVALKEVDDLRWFYYHCKKYSNTKDKQGRQNSFNKAFFGALKIK